MQNFLVLKDMRVHTMGESNINQVHLIFSLEYNLLNMKKEVSDQLMIISSKEVILL